MKHLLIFSNKSKSGKAALACSLADTATREYEKKTAIIDTNPRRDASHWAKIYEQQMNTDLVVEPGHISCVPEYLRRIGEQKTQPDWILISARTSEKFSLAVAAAKAVDLVLIPYHPTLSDLWAIDAPIKAASKAETPAMIVLNAKQGGNLWRKDAEDYLSKLLESHPNVQKAPTELENHEDFVRLLVQGKDFQETDNSSKIEEATQEIRDLCQCINGYIG